MKKDSILRNIFTLISKYKLLVISSILLAFVSVVLTLFSPILIGRAIDLIVKKGEVDYEGICKILIILALVVTFSSISQWLMNLCNNKITYCIVNDIRNKTFKHIEYLNLKYIDSKAQGDIVSTMITDIDQISDGLLVGFSQLFIGIITIIGTLLIITRIDYVVALVVAFLTPISLLIASFIAKKTYKLFEASSKSRAKLTSIIDEYVGNQKIIQAFSYEDRSIEKFIKVNNELQDNSMKATFYSSLVNPSTRFLNSVVFTFVGIVGGLSVIAGRISVGQLASLLTYSNQYTKPFNEISGVITEFQNALACAKRVFELLNEETVISVDKGKIELDNVKGEIELNNVDFSYIEGKKLISNINLNVDKGNKVAIVGPTGCGKSTIINLLMKFYDVNSGEIKIDNINIKEITVSSLRNNFGMVLQETWLKTGTIRENIAYGKDEATEEEIINAAKNSFAHGFIKRLPNGYETFITEDGGNLSQGEKQLLCIARVMIKMPPILILDEATSSIDTITEQKIQKALIKMMEGRTSFIVAHRLSTIKDSDIILVMRDGNIVEQGSHDDLISINGFYANLYNSQFASQ